VHSKAQSIRWITLSGSLVCIAAVVGWLGSLAALERPQFVPVLFQNEYQEGHSEGLDEVILFPPDGPRIKIPMPAGLPVGPRVLTFSRDGRSIYAQKLEGANRWSAVLKIDFQPTRWTEVLGTADLGLVHCLDASDPSRLVVRASPSLKQFPRTLEISPETGAIRQLPVNGPTRCIARSISVPPRGFLSPDGTRTVINNGTEARVVTLQSGNVQIIRQSSPDTYWTWSPDGRRLAGIVKDDIILVDSNDTSRPKNLGSHGEDPIKWSPDSSRLLIVREQLSCAPTIYGTSLQILYVETGKREAVRGSHCRVWPNDAAGWMDREIAR